MRDYYKEIMYKTYVGGKLNVMYGTRVHYFSVVKAPL